MMCSERWSLSGVMCPHPFLVLCPTPCIGALHPEESESSRVGGGAIWQRKEPWMEVTHRLREEASARLSGSLQSEGGVQVPRRQAKQGRVGDHGVGV